MHTDTVAADTEAYEPVAQLANPGWLYGRDAPMQTPLTDPVQVLEVIKKGYAADRLYAHASMDKRASLGIQAHGTLFLRGAAICVPDNSELRTAIIRELHCSPYAGHMGMNRTHALISRYFFWPHMRESINTFVGGCVVCQRNKPSNSSPAGKLMPLPVPKAIWEDVSMDVSALFLELRVAMTSYW